jgi:hypothetical protein
MPHLANNALRTKNMAALLIDMGIKGGGVRCTNELMVLTPHTPQESTSFTQEIQKLLKIDTPASVQQFTLNELLAQEINSATCADMMMSETNKRALHALLPILKLDFVFNEEQEFLDIPLPSPAYASLFSLLNYHYLIVKGDTLRFDIKDYLKAHREELFLIEGANPILFSLPLWFEQKQVFYAYKEVSADEVEVTPHIFIPRAAQPPHYHFVLDTSDSMGIASKQNPQRTRLQMLQESAIKFAEALFEFQPNAVIKITQFDSTIQQVGVYHKKDFPGLSQDITRLYPRNSTCLFATALEQLAALAGSKDHTNTLLFTDGENTLGNEYALTAELEQNIASLQQGSPLVLARNKLFIISYGVNQPAILHRVTDLFCSPVINTNSPDFIAALSEQNKMQEWAASRELFTCRMEVIANSAVQKEESYVRTYDLSGQFTALAPIRCKAQEGLKLTVLDGNGDVLLVDSQPLAMNRVAPPAPKTIVLPGSAKAATDLGLFTGLSTRSRPDLSGDVFALNSAGIG